MFCKQCGCELVDGAKFCAHCGTATPPPATIAVAAPKKRSSKKGWIAGIALVLVLALLATGGFLLIDNFDDWFGGGRTLSSAGNENTTEPSTDPSDPTDPEEPGPVVDPNRQYHLQEAELIYALTEDDIAAFQQALAEFEALAMSSADEETVMDSYDALEEKFDYLSTQYSIASVLHYCDLNDETASRRYLDCTETVTNIQELYIEAMRRIYQANVPTMDTLFADWTAQDILMLEKYTAEVGQLTKRNAEIKVEYQELQSDSNFNSRMIPLYLEMVCNNNRIAQIYGYDNYYEYAYTVAYSRDYSQQEVETMRAYAAQYLAPALSQSLQNYYTSAQSLTYADYLTLSALMYNSYQDTDKPYVVNYLDTLPLYARDSMLDMFDGNIILRDDSENARAGAFTTTVGKNQMVCFYGPGYSDSMTVIHEAGHYYGGKFTDLNDIPLDLAETHSQGNEWLFMCYLKNELNTNVYETLYNYKTFSQIGTVLLSLIVDEFEQLVYTHADPASLTEQDLYTIMESVCEKYGGSQLFTDNSLISPHDYWRMVVVEQPVYYISYGVSAMASMDLYTISVEDTALAIDIYVSLIEDADPERGFLGNLSDAGLSGPFEAAVYEKIYALVA